MAPERAYDQLVGRSLGEFVLRERIGEGGFGAVYRATQATLDREAVVKVLHAQLHKSPAATERFLREAKLASKLDHPYAAHIYAFGAEPDGELWIAMEFVRGTPLSQVLKIQGPLSLERFVPLLDRICEVVHTAHEQGIVHRDLKPANVMVLARAGRLLPKLVDFGIAKGLAEAESLTAEITPPTLVPEVTPATADTMASATPSMNGLTQRGVIMGSPPYMAPEQWIDAGHVDGRGDLYALGILSYECLTGHPPFTATTVTEMARAHSKQAPPPLGPRFPAALDKVFAKVLAKQPGDRYRDALAFATAFRQAAGISPEAIALPAIDPAVRNAALSGAPQPIADAIAALDAARNAHQARDAIVQVARAITRYLGLLALACRSRVTGDDEPIAVHDAMRRLYRRSLSDLEWLELARQLTGVWLTRRDAYPIPELIDCFHEGSTRADLEALAALRDREAPSDEAMVAVLESAVARMSSLLPSLAGIFYDYVLVVTGAAGIAERWTGVRRTQRTTIMVPSKAVPAGVAALVDQDGAPVLTLSPLFQIAPPTPGAPLDLFLFEGRDGRGAKLVSLPAGFEHHDEGVWDWFRIQLAGSLHEADAAIAEGKAPYRGLSAFTVEDGETFFGREKLVDAFANRLKLQPLLAVVGRSGAGKSSFVQAGVIPSLPQGWRAITMRPGAAPLATLLARLEQHEIERPGLAGPRSTPEGSAQTIGGKRADLRDAIARDREALGALLRADAAARGPILLVVDQLEEMFTLCDDGEERRVFAEAIAAAARTAEDPVRVIFTLRDDFLVRTEQVPALRNRIGQGLQLLTVPGPEDLLRILVEPARRAGYELEGDLADEMVKEVADQPGALALISFAAAKLWELRDRHFKQLTRAAYKTLGGVGGALAKHADVTLDEMPPEERALAREAFRHLVTSQNTRAVLSRKDLRQLLGNDEHADQVIEKLVATRLLVASENESGAETIEIVHEALLVAWPRLLEWRREDAEGARFREQLRAAAEQWHERGRAKGLLWRDDALAEYTRWRARHAGPLTDVESAFSDASLADAARGRRNLRILLAGAFASLVAVVVGLVVFNTKIAGQRARAESAAHDLHDNLQRQYEEQGRRFVLTGEPRQALAYLAKSAELGVQGRAHDFLVAQAVQALAGELLEVHHQTSVIKARFSHDGNHLLTAGLAHSARIWNARDGKLEHDLPHTGDVYRASFSPDDATVLTGSLDGRAILWDAHTGRVVHEVKHPGVVLCAVFSPDGRVAATGGRDGGVSLWSVPGGTELAQLHDGAVSKFACAFSPDGALFAAGDTDGTTRIWDAHTGALLHEMTGAHARIGDLRFTRDGKRLVTASHDGTAAEWNIDGTRLQSFTHRAAVFSIDASPDGKSIVTASLDHTAIVWDAETGQRRFTLEGHHGGLWNARFSPDGSYIVTVSEDATVRLWDARTGRTVARWLGHEDRVLDAAFDSDGSRVVTSADDGSVIVWKVEPQQRVTWLTGHHAAIYEARFSPDGGRVLTASLDGTARVWEATTGAELHQLHEPEQITGATFNPDGTRIATRSSDGSVRVWDAGTGRPLKLLTSKALGTDGTVAWSHDGMVIAATSNDGWLRCWNAETGELRFEQQAHGGAQVWSGSFDPSGSRLITSGNDLTTRIWDLAGHQQLEHRDPDAAATAQFDPTGRRVLSVISRERAKIWDVATGKTLVELVGHLGRVVEAKWAHDGEWVVTASADGTARIWDASSGDQLEILTHPSGAIVAAFSPDDARVVVAGDDGSAAIYSLPRAAPSAANLAQLLRCRVPFEVRGDRLVPRARDARACNGY